MCLYWEGRHILNYIRKRSIADNILLVLASTIFSLFIQTAAFATNPPIISPSTGVYSQVQSQVTITADPGDTIYFTQDNSDPTPSSPEFVNPIPIGSSAVIKAIAWNSGVSSSIVTAIIQSDANSKPVPRTGLKLWLKSDFGPLTSGANVIQWNDLSGAASANNATQSTASAQPTLVSDAINDFPAVQFNGTSQFLNLTSGLSNLSSGASLFAVIKPVGTGTSTLLTTGNSGPSDQMSLEAVNTQAQFTAYNGTTGSTLASPSGSLTLNKFQELDSVHSGAASASINVNTASVASGAVENLINTSRTLNFIGSDGTANFFNGQLAELLIYDRPVTVSERADIGAYLFTRYQLSTAVATAAPIISVASGTLPGPTQVAIAAEAGSTVYITQDGSDPNPGTSPVYSKPLNINYTQTLKALSVANGVSSSISSASYTLDANKWPAPDPLDTRPLTIDLQLPTTSQ